MAKPKDRFVNLFCELARRSFTDPPSGQQRKQLMEAFLEFGSQTEDSLNCYNHIEYGLVPGFRCRRSAYGLKLKGKDVPISDVIHAVEDLRLPNEIKEQFPNLTSEEWDAVTRMATMILIALESEAASDHNSP